MAKSSLTTGLTPQEVVDLKVSIASSTVLVNRLIHMLTKNVELLDKDARAKENYSKSGWPYLQADIIGGKRALLNTIEMLKTLDK